MALLVICYCSIGQRRLIESQ
jgi:hypothetical protein